MKITRLLALSALWLVGLSASAADLVERLEPTNADVPQKAVAFEAGKTYLLYNVGTQKFYTQGNAWGTRASVGPLEEAIRVRLEVYAPEGQTLEEATYEFFNYSCIRSRTYSWHQSFFDSDVALFTDLGSQANKYWAVADQGNNVYRLKAAQANPSIKSDGTQFVGRDDQVANDVDNLYADLPNEEILPLSPLLIEGEGIHIDWQFFDASVFAVFDKSKELKAQIEAAEAQNVDVSAATAVYNNLNSTIEQMEAAIAALKEAMNNNIANGTADNPTDATSKIANPNFDNASATGWQGTAPNMVGSGSHGPADVAEQYNKTFDTYQDLSDLPNGVYAMGAYGFYRSGSTDGSYENWVNHANYNAFFYAVTDGDSLTTAVANPFEAQCTEDLSGATEFGTTASTIAVNGYFIPNDPSAGRLFFERGWLKHNLFFAVENGQARIGVKKSVTISTDWTVFDQFSLTYYGNTAESFQKWVDMSAPSVELGDDVFTQQYLDDYEAALQAAKATNKAEAIAAIAALNEAYAPLQKNVTLWKQWQQKCDEGRALSEDSRYSELYSAYDLNEYCTFDAEDILAARSLTNEELEAAIEMIDKMMDQVREDYAKDVPENTDMTDYLVNADFSNGANGWTRAGKQEGNVRAAENCYEAWHCTDFDIYQVVKNMPAGLYEISVQGFVRYHDGTDAVNQWENNNRPDIPVFVYLNNATGKFANIFEVPMEAGYYTGSSTKLTSSDGMYEYPDNMAAAAQAFGDGYYTTTAYGLISDGQELRIGVKGTPVDCWAIWDNFKLTYKKYNAELMREVLTDALTTIEADQAMGKDIYNKVSAAIEAANAALAGNDGMAMFRALSDIYDLNDEISKSVALFNTLKEANESLMSAIGTYSDSPAAGEAVDLFETIDGNIANHEYENADVAGLLEQIKKMKTKLRLPADVAQASDLNPVDVTAIIETPGFEKDGANSNEGWEGSTGNFGNDDTQKAAYAYEFYNTTFDFYQDILGLPEGIYELSVGSFCRNGGIAADYTKFQEDPEYSEAYLYSVSKDSVVSSVAVAPLFKGALTEDPGLAGESTYTPEGQAEGSEVIYYIPNDMQSAAAFFTLDGSAYVNKMIVKVGDDEKLRIGLKKTVNSDTGWVLVDNWTLTYYGKNSSLQPAEDAWQKANGIEEQQMTAAEVAKVEFFSLDGRKAGMAQKGIIIMKQTMTDGTIVVKKIRK